MAKKAVQPWSQVQQLADQLGELFDQMEADPTVAEDEITSISRYCLGEVKKLAEQQLAGSKVRRTKKTSRSPWTEVIELGRGLKEQMDIIAEDTAVDTNLW